VSFFVGQAAGPKRLSGNLPNNKKGLKPLKFQAFLLWSYRAKSVIWDRDTSERNFPVVRGLGLQVSKESFLTLLGPVIVIGTYHSPQFLI
jgi:hypothetical protein